MGIALTLLFTPEPLGVPLLELDRKYAYYQAGKVYHGELVLLVSRSEIACRLGQLLYGMPIRGVERYHPRDPTYDMAVCVV